MRLEAGKPLLLRGLAHAIRYPSLSGPCILARVAASGLRAALRHRQRDMASRTRSTIEANGPVSANATGEPAAEG